MDFSILPQDLTFRKATLSQNVRRRSVRARLPPIATFSHNLFEIKTSNRRPATHDTAPGWKCVTSRSSRFFCEQPGCVYALNKVPFKFKCRLNQHLLSHQTVGRFKCPSCDNIFKTKENLVRHSRLHQNAKPYTCEVCDRSFARTSDRSCCRKHHSLCSKSNTATDLKQLEHMSALDKELALNRSKPRPYVCKICGDRRSYTDPGSLRKHKRRYHQDSVGIAPSNKENLSRSSAMFCSGTCVGSHPPLPHSKALNLSEPLLSNSSCQMVDACVSTDQTLLDHSLIEPRLYPNGFLLPSSPVPEFASWSAQPSDCSFSERHQEPASDLVSSNGQELFTGFHPEEHLVLHQPSSPVDLCKSALCLQVVPYGVICSTRMNCPSTTDSDSVVLQESHTWCLCLTTFQQFLLWDATAVEWLRRNYRIVGRASYSCEAGRQKDIGTSTTPSSLPVRLSFEESVHLLNLGVLKGFQRAFPVTKCKPPSSEQLDAFARALEFNALEMQQLSETKRRLQLTCRYNQLLSGLSVHRKRQLSNSDQDRTIDVPKVSVRTKRKMLKSLKKSKSHSQPCSGDMECLGNEPEQEEVSKETDQTLESLIDFYSSNRPPPSSSLVTCKEFSDRVPRHLPRSTPMELLRPNETQRICLPDIVKSEGLIAIATWLFQQVQSAGTQSDHFPGENSKSCAVPEHQLIRCRVFSDLWSRGHFVTTSTVKMGGDFLIYPGDPLNYHASHIVFVSCSEDVIRPQLIASKLRLANSVRKVLVLAVVLSRPTNELQIETQKSDVLYTSFEWAGGIK